MILDLSLCHNFHLESTNMVSKENQVYHKNLGDWVKLSEMESPAYCHCLVVLNDYLFVVGGQEIFGNQFLKASDKKIK